MEIEPTDSFAWLTLGDAYKVLSRFNDARAAMDQSLTHASEERCWMVMARRAAIEGESGHPEDAEFWYEKAFAQPVFSTSRWPHTLRGANLIRLERFVEAEKHLRHSTELQDDYDENDLDEAWHMLGVSLLAQERLDEAAEALRTALDINPESDISRKQLEGLKEFEIARQMISVLPSPRIDKLA